MTEATTASGSSGVVILGLMVFFYLLPAIVAGARGHLNGLAIFMLNLLLGWTLLGWVWALVWACTNNTERERRRLREEDYYG